MLIPSWLKIPTHFGHEVYVLTPQQISSGRQAAKIHPLQVLSNSRDLKTFIIYGLLITGSLLAALYLKSQPIFQKLGRFIDRATYFAPDIIRVSLGASLIAAAHFHAVFGPELPISHFPLHQFFEPFLYISGISIVVGLFSRWWGAIVSVFWLLIFVDQGWYTLTYLNYLGEALALLLIRRQNISLDALLFKKPSKTTNYSQWAMPIARILFGLALVYAAINVKFVTAKLSLDVVNQYHLTHYFHFDPLFVVLGAGLVEILMAGLFMLGLLQRLNALAFMTFITLSLLYFKEAVWPHYLLLGLAAGIFLHKPDRLALDGRLFKRR